MGRGHGSGRGTSAKAGGFQGDRSMRDMSAGLAKAVSAAERDIRDKSVEHGFVFDKDGNIIDRGIGRNGSVMLRHEADAIMTHNHPALEANGKRRADGGGSFSKEDVMGALGHNMQEIRAVTEHYTYSLKRPKAGWGIDYSKGFRGSAYNFNEKTGSRTKTEGLLRKERTWKKAEDYINRKLNSYVANYKGDKATAIRRGETLRSHLIVKAYAKNYGWEYTKTYNP